MYCLFLNFHVPLCHMPFMSNLFFSITHHDIHVKFDVLEHTSCQSCKFFFTYLMSVMSTFTFLTTPPFMSNLTFFSTPHTSRLMTLFLALSHTQSDLASSTSHNLLVSTSFFSGTTLEIQN
jgi:hypothetical protein